MKENQREATPQAEKENVNNLTIRAAPRSGHSRRPFSLVHPQQALGGSTAQVLSLPSRQVGAAAEPKAHGKVVVELWLKQSGQSAGGSGFPTQRCGPMVPSSGIETCELPALSPALYFPLR